MSGLCVSSTEPVYARRRKSCGGQVKTRPLVGAYNQVSGGRTRFVRVCVGMLSTPSQKYTSSAPPKDLDFFRLSKR